MHGRGVERVEAIAALPIFYQRLLACLQEGKSVEEISDLLEIEGDAVDPMIRLAEAKVARLSQA